MMKKLLGILLCFVMLTVSLVPLLCAQVKVSGYYRKDGTYVAPHYRSKPNSTVRDNYSYKGNVNPHTGKVGTNYYRDNPTSEYYQLYQQSIIPEIEEQVVSSSPTQVQPEPYTGVSKYSSDKTIVPAVVGVFLFTCILTFAISATSN